MPFFYWRQWPLLHVLVEWHIWSVHWKGLLSFFRRGQLRSGNVEVRSGWTREGRSQLEDANREGERHRDSDALPEALCGAARRLDRVALLLPSSATSHGAFPDPRHPQTGEILPLGRVSGGELPSLVGPLAPISLAR